LNLGSSIRKYGPTIGLAILTGCLWATPFLVSRAASIAWLIPSLVLLVAGSSPRLSPFQLGYVIGLYFHLTGLYWLLNIPVLGGAIAGWLVLSFYCALFPAGWAWFCWRMLPSTTKGSPDSHTTPRLLQRVGKMNWGQRQLWALVCAVAWTAMEMLQSNLLTGFPWNLLGMSQIELLPLIQIASVTGVYGVSFIVVWVSLTLCLAVTQILVRPGQPLSWSRELLLSGSGLALVIVLGFLRLVPGKASTETIKVAVIQPSINQTVIWEGTHTEERFTDLIRLSREALTHEPDLLIWPESGLPSNLESPERVSQFVAEYQIPLIFNGVDASSPNEAGTREYYNAAFLMNARGQVIDRAHKHHLVMFGEYTPFADKFPFLQKLSPIGVGFAPGPSGETLELEDPALKLGVLICFEDVFPSLARELARGKPNLMVNLTNDAWFGHSQAQWQHAKAAAFRAIETGIPLIRCTNNGISCWINRYGRIFTGPIAKATDVYQAGYRILNVPLANTDSEPTLTRHTQDGDLFGWVCVSSVFALLFLRELFRVRGSSHDSNFDSDLLRDPE
jgi:apolipoprotein N-acyltransferase